MKPFDLIKRRLRLPLIAAPMFTVSGPDLVIAACRSGVIGAFPTANCRSLAELDAWLGLIHGALDADCAPMCANLIMRRGELQDEVDLLIHHSVEIVITSVGSPAPVVDRLRSAGCVILADVSSVRHAHRAIESGVDGLVLLSAGAGGQTGWINGLAFTRAVRAFFDGPLVLSGGVVDGTALRAAEVVGCDLGMMGTPFIATSESMADPEYKQMVADGGIDDVMLTSALTGLDANLLRPSLVRAGLDPDHLPTAEMRGDAARRYDRADGGGPKRWKDIWSAGHSIAAIDRIVPAAERIAAITREYDATRCRYAN